MPLGSSVSFIHSIISPDFSAQVRYMSMLASPDWVWFAWLMSVGTSSVWSGSSAELSAPMASRAAAMAPPFSSTITFAPFCAAVVAATRPPLPAPTTTRSASSVSAMSVGISGLSRQLPCAASPSFAVASLFAWGAQPESAPAAASVPAAVSPARKPRRLMVFSAMVLLLLRSVARHVPLRPARPRSLRAILTDAAHHRRARGPDASRGLGYVGYDVGKRGKIPENG